MKQNQKCAVNVKARADRVAEAKALGINLSATFDAALEAAVKKARLAKWQDDNREAFEAYDRRIEANGVFSAGKRRF